MDITDLRIAAQDAADHELDLSEWELASGDWIALGPVLAGRRVGVKPDRSVFWTGWPSTENQLTKQ